MTSTAAMPAKPNVATPTSPSLAVDGASAAGDLQIERLSDALSGMTLDVVVTGSIGAVESVRFIRALRRLGAEATPWLTAGGAQFVTGTALAWAAARGVREHFAGDAAHIALQDGCIIAPASASIVAKIALGITDTPASALVASYLGRGLPVILVPNMHDSLANSPGVQRNLATLGEYGVHVVEPRIAEAKHKFPVPAVLADRCAHLLNNVRRRRQTKDGSPLPRVLITMGSTRGYIDAVRYVSNYSSGRLGSLVAEELYRRGFATDVVCGPCEFKPHAYGQLTPIYTNDDLASAAAAALTRGANAAVLAASVLDFTPTETVRGKISSKDHGQLHIELTRTAKLIAKINPGSGVKVGFKLETGLTPERAQELATAYMHNYGLSLLVVNDLDDVDATRHRATVFEVTSGRTAGATAVPTGRMVTGKAALAEQVADHISRALARSAF